MSYAPVDIPNPADTKIILGKILSNHQEYDFYSKIVVQKDDGTLIVAYCLKEDMDKITVTNKLCYLEVALVKANEHTYYDERYESHYHFPVSGIFVTACMEKAPSNTISFN